MSTYGSATNRVLLTGATGFVGRHLQSALGNLPNLVVHAVSRRPAASQPDGSTIVWHAADLLDEQHVATLLREVKPTHLAHLAWTTEHSTYWQDPANDRWAEAGVMLLRNFAESGGRRAVMVGTCAEYAWGFGDGVCHEDSTPLIPATRYGIGKHRLHLASAAVAHETGVSLAWVRLFQLYGPGENPHRLAPSVIQALLRDKTASCSAGTQVRDFIHVTDVASAIAALLANDFQGAINIGTGLGISVREFVEAISAELGQTQRVKFGARQLSPGEPSTLVANVTRLRATIGSWNPICLSRGIKDTVAWWQSAEAKDNVPR